MQTAQLSESIILKEIKHPSLNGILVLQNLNKTPD